MKQNSAVTLSNVTFYPVPESKWEYGKCHMRIYNDSCPAGYCCCVQIRLAACIFSGLCYETVSLAVYIIRERLWRGHCQRPQPTDILCVHVCVSTWAGCGCFAVSLSIISMCGCIWGYKTTGDVCSAQKKKRGKKNTQVIRRNWKIYFNKLQCSKKNAYTCLTGLLQISFCERLMLIWLSAVALCYSRLQTQSESKHATLWTWQMSAATIYPPDAPECLIVGPSISCLFSLHTNNHFSKCGMFWQDI